MPAHAKIPSAALLALALGTAACGGREATSPPPAPPPTARGAQAMLQPASPAAPESAAASKPPLPEVIAKTWRGIGAAFNAHDADKLASYFTDDAIVDTYGAPEVLGRTAFIRSLEEEFAAFPDLRGSAVRSFQKANVGVVEVVVAGTMMGDWMGLRASKRRVGDRHVIFAHFNDDGLITHWHVYADLAGRTAQMRGAKDAPPVPDVPASPPEVHAGLDTPEEEKLVEWATAATATLGSGDAKAATALFAPAADVTFYPLGGKVLANRDADRLNAELLRAAPGAKFGIVGVWGVDGFVVIERTVQGTLKGRFAWLPPSSKEFTLHLADVWQPTADGKLAHAWTYGNLAEVALQTGAMKPPPPPAVASAVPPAPAAPKK